MSSYYSAGVWDSNNRPFLDRRCVMRISVNIQFKGIVTLGLFFRSINSGQYERNDDRY